MKSLRLNAKRFDAQIEDRDIVSAAGNFWLAHRTYASASRWSELRMIIGRKLRALSRLATEPTLFVLIADDET